MCMRGEETGALLFSLAFRCLLSAAVIPLCVDSLFLPRVDSSARLPGEGASSVRQWWGLYAEKVNESVGIGLQAALMLVHAPLHWNETASIFALIVPAAAFSWNG